MSRPGADLEPTRPASAYEILRALFPALPAEPVPVRNWRSPPEGTRRLLAVPSLRDTRMFLPAEPSRTAAALRRARRSVDRRGRVVTEVAATGLRLGLARSLRAHVEVPGTPDSVEAELVRLLGRPVTLAVFLGPTRANRKPVLQVIADDGELLAVAKVGVNALTSRLAEQEAAALRLVGTLDLPTVEAPRLLGLLRHGEHHVVVQSALDVPATHTGPDASVLARVFSEIARAGGSTHEPLAATAYAGGLRERVGRSLAGPLADEATAALDRACARGRSLEIGSWHGDLSPWNLAAKGDRALVWDWERFEHGVPVGLDALHHAFLPRLKDGGLPEAEAGSWLLERAVEVLAPVGVAREDAGDVAMLYLVEIATRFAGDGQARTGIMGGDVERWLAPALRRYLHEGA